LPSKRKDFQQVTGQHMTSRILNALGLGLECNGDACGRQHANIRVAIANCENILGSQTKLFAHVK
jgi:hypothetical protein